MRATAEVDPSSARGRTAPPAAGEGRGTTGLVLRRVGLHAGVLTLFAIPAVALWWHAWDGHLASTLTCACGDAGQTVWFVAWPAYAVAHGLDPFFSTAVQAPHGINLLANASAVPVGVLLAPLTLTAGPIVATNLALTLSPALSAWACWVACRGMVTWEPAAIVAGALFGYSPFVVTNLALGHLGLALLVAPPLLVVASRKILFGPSETRRRWGAALGALLGLQYFLSGELLAIVVVVGFPCALLGMLAGRRDLARAGEILGALGAAALVLALLVTVPVWFFLAGPQHLQGPLWHVQGNNLDALWNPGRYGGRANVLVRLGGYEGKEGPASAYLGPVVLALAAGALGVAWRRRTARLLAAGAVVAAVCALGSVLWVAPGHPSSLWLPWRIVSSWPLLDDVIPQRFSAVTDMCVALLVGVGFDAVARRARTRGPGRVRDRATALVLALAAAVALGSLWRTYQVPFSTRRVVVPAWYRTAALRLPPGTVVLSVPFPFPSDAESAPMVWQALDGMRFRLAGSYAKAPGPGGRPLSHRPVPEPYGVLAALTSPAGGVLPAAGPTQVRAVRTALARWRVEVVVVLADGRDSGRAVQLFSEVADRAPRREHGAWVWRLATSAQDSRASGAG